MCIMRTRNSLNLPLQSVGDLRGPASCCWMCELPDGGGVEGLRQWSQSEQGTEKEQPQHVGVLTVAGEVEGDVLGTRPGHEVLSRSCLRVGHLVQE